MAARGRKWHWAVGVALLAVIGGIPVSAIAYRSPTEEESDGLIAATTNLYDGATGFTLSDIRMSGNWASAEASNEPAEWHHAPRLFYAGQGLNWRVVAAGANEGEGCIEPEFLPMPKGVALELGACKPPPLIHRHSRVVFRPGDRGVSIVLSKPEDGSECERDPTFGRISVSDAHSRLVMQTYNICGDTEAWTREGGVLGFQPTAKVWNSRGRSGSTVAIWANGDNATREYRIVVRTKDRRAVGWLTINRQRFWSYQRVYEGTDAFVNYCIDRGREIHSLHGRLFCWRQTPVRGPNLIAFHRRRWH